MLRIAALALLAIVSQPALSAAPGITVKPGESWTFSLSKGQPVKVRRADAAAKPARGRIKVTVRSMMGTSLSIVSANAVPYTYKAELIDGGKRVAARSCTLPAGGKLSFEHWPESADAVRLSDFRPAPKDGSCP